MKIIFSTLKLYTIHYPRKITKFVSLKMTIVNLENMYVDQDDATPHSAN